jgi:hypothetical protein
VALTVAERASAPIIGANCFYLGVISHVAMYCERFMTLGSQFLGC